MKVLFIDFTLPYLLKDSEFPVGGWAVQLKHLLVALSGAGHQAGVLTWKGANAYVGEQNVFDLLETYDPNSGIRKLRLVYSFLPSLVMATRAYRPDIIIQSCAGFNTGVMALIAKALGVPFIHRIACDTDADGRYAAYLSPRERIGFRVGLARSDLVICQNEYQLDNIRRSYPDKKVRLFHNIVADTGDKMQPNARATRGYIAWLGVFRRQKNLARLYTVARNLPSIEFRVGGMPPPDGMDGETAEAVEKLRALSNVKFEGYVKRNDLAEFLGRAIALLSTSDFEGFSNTFLEALHLGTPIVARKAIDPDSVVADNKLGFVGEMDEDLVECVRKISQMDAVDYDALALCCRDYVEARHSPHEGISEFIEILRSAAR